jgi:hypothetical protein
LPLTPEKDSEHDEKRKPGKGPRLAQAPVPKCGIHEPFIRRAPPAGSRLIMNDAAPDLATLDGYG